MKRQTLKTLKKIAVCALFTIILYASSVSADAEELFSDSDAAEQNIFDNVEDEFSDGTYAEMFASDKKAEPARTGSAGLKSEDGTIIQDDIIYKEDESWKNELHIIGYTENLKGKTEIIIPEQVNGMDVSFLDSGCFRGLEGVKTIELSREIWMLAEDAFDSWNGITIRCALNSDAYFFAVEHGISVDTSTMRPDYVKEDSGVIYIFDPQTASYTIGFIECDCFSKDPADIVLRNEIMGYPVKRIDTERGANNYYDDDEPLAFNGVKSIYIPNSIDKIAEREFTYHLCNDFWTTYKEWGYVNLTSVVFEDGETPIELGEHLFDYCPSLIEVKLSSRIRELPAYMFVDCKALTELELPEGMTKIGQAALQGVPNLEYLYIPSSVTDIADDAMDGLTKLTVHGEANSYAEYYCRTHGIPFEAEGSAEQEKPYIVSAKGELKDHWLHFTVELLREMDGAEGYEYQTLASDGETVLRTKNAAAASCVLAKAPNDIYVRVRSWNTENGEKVYSQWSDKAHLYLDVKAGNMVLKKAAANGRKVTLTFGDNANFFKESDGFDCRLEKTASNGKTYAKQNQKYRTVTFTNVKPGTYTAKARAYKLVNGKKVYGERSNTIRVTVR